MFEVYLDKEKAVWNIGTELRGEAGAMDSNFYEVFECIEVDKAILKELFEGE